MTPLNNIDSPSPEIFRNMTPSDAEVKKALAAFFGNGEVAASATKPKSAKDVASDAFDAPATGMHPINTLFAKLNEDDALIKQFIAAIEYSWATAPNGIVSYSHFVTHSKFLNLEMAATRFRPLWRAYVKVLTTMSPPRLIQQPSLDDDDPIYEIR